jgi:hypothetical protein
MTTRPVPWFQPQDRMTKGSAVWLAALIALLPGVERYGLKYDKEHPGNREKWTLTSNWLTVFGWDSISGQPANVKFGAIRRALGLFCIAWLFAHWCLPVAKRGTY